MWTEAGSFSHMAGAFPRSLQAPREDAQLGAVSLTTAEKIHAEVWLASLGAGGDRQPRGGRAPMRGTSRAQRVASMRLGSVIISALTARVTHTTILVYNTTVRDI